VTDCDLEYGFTLNDMEELMDSFDEAMRFTGDGDD
jgi:hypothetical protein